ncbi:MAG: GNAT family N-acetyltransferase, partial [Deltaproteobacteria bacterium]|nr:GNAT family N-acetyltransferase [Deltaproteobacteria bacterium]
GFMKKAAEFSSFVSRGGELRLSNFGQMQLMLGAAERGVPLRMMVRGFSMAPCIRDEDLVTIVPLKGSLARVGEVVAFIAPDTGLMIIHRVIARRGEGYVMRGDNASASDGVIAPENIIGRVTCVTRRGRPVLFGLGAEGAWIAALHRGDALMRLKTLLRLPRRAAGVFLRWLQCRAVYRAIGKRCAPRIAIVAAGADDVEAVQLYLNPGQPYRDAPDPNVTNWVAKAGAKVIGFVQCLYDPEPQSIWAGYWLFSMTVWRRYRGLGIGEALTRRVIEYARAQGAGQLLLTVWNDNDSAMCMYCKLGFKPVILPALEPGLEAEAKQLGRRRIVMCKGLGVC